MPSRTGAIGWTRASMGRRVAVDGSAADLPAAAAPPYSRGEARVSRDAARGGHCHAWEHDRHGALLVTAARDRFAALAMTVLAVLRGVIARRPQADAAVSCR